MESLLSDENIIFKKTKYNLILLYITLTGIGMIILILGFQYFFENELSSSGKLSFLLNLITFILVLAQVWYQEMLTVKCGEISIASNVFKKYKFRVEDVRCIDKHFDEWSFHLKNDKKYVISQHQIKKEDLPRFRTFMLPFPQKHPNANL